MTLDQPYPVTRVEVWNRQGCCEDRFVGAVISLFDQNDDEFFTETFGSSAKTFEINVQATDVGVPVDGSWQHPLVSNSLGQYFVYDTDTWKQDFSAVPTSTSGSVVDVKQCRDGKEVWSGQVKVWPEIPNHQGKGYDLPPAGRRNSGSSKGQWKKHDYVVKVSLHYSTFHTLNAAGSL